MAVPLAVLDAVRVDETTLEPDQLLVHRADAPRCTQEFLSQAFIHLITSLASVAAMRSSGLQFTSFPLAFLAHARRRKPQTGLHFPVAIFPFEYLWTSGRWNMSVMAYICLPILLTGLVENLPKLAPSLAESTLDGAASSNTPR